MSLFNTYTYTFLYIDIKCKPLNICDQIFPSLTPPRLNKCALDEGCTLVVGLFLPATFLLKDVPRG